VLLIYRMMLRMIGFRGCISDFGAIGISRCLGAWCSVHRRLQHNYTSYLASFGRYTFYLASCVIWKWVIHLGFGKRGNSSQAFTTENRIVFKSVKYFQSPPAYTPRLFKLCVCAVKAGSCQSFQDGWNMFKKVKS
jgi:hypothetical protein